MISNIFSFPLKTWWKCRKYWKFPHVNFYMGRIKNGYTWFVSTEYLKWRTKPWFPILIHSSDVLWKDKYGEPRFEMPPVFSITIGRNYNTAFQIVFWFTVPKVQNIFYDKNTMPEHLKYPIDDDYWESMLWYLYYTKTDSYYTKGYNEENGKCDFLKACVNYFTGEKHIYYDDNEIIVKRFEDTCYLTDKAKIILKNYGDKETV